MIKFRRKPKTTFITLRAEDLQTGDRFVYDNVAVAVLTNYQDGDDVSVLLDTTHPGSPPRSRMVSLRKEMLITVSR